MILMVLDATDIEGSIPRDYLKKLSGGDYELFIAVNKVDCIPESVSREKFKGWIAARIKELMPEISVVRSKVTRTTSIWLWSQARRQLV